METTEIETEAQILGEKKHFEVDYDFSYGGETFTKGERLEIDAETARQLMTLRTYAAIDGGKYHVLAGRVIGGLFTIERSADHFHKVSFWHRSYSEEDPWIKVVFLEASYLIANQGDKRRLRKSDALAIQHRYLDSSMHSSTYHLARIEIQEYRPKPAMSAEESAARSAAVMAGMAKDRSDSWTLGNFKRL